MSTMTWNDIPSISAREAVKLTMRQPMTRRQFGRRAVQAGLATGVAYAALLSRTKPAAAGGNYFWEHTGTTTGPCHPTTGYARHHTEQGLKCGPSAVCYYPYNQHCCSTGTSSPTPTSSTWYNTAQKRGWHRYSQWDPVYKWYSQRPNDCYQSKYDSWRWKFSNNVVYGCSDGVVCNGTTYCYISICAWAR